MIDALIIGTGVSGLCSALKIAESGLKVCIITRANRPEVTNTNWAQGGIIFNENTSEDCELFIKDIMKASSFTSNIHAAEVLAKKSPEILKEILIDKVKTDFNRSADGELQFTKEAAHSKARIIYRGDYTGRAIQVSLLNYLSDKERFPNITFLEGHTAIDLITNNHHGVSIHQRYEERAVLGAYVLNQGNSVVKKIVAKVTVLATGGIGSLYLHNSNSEGARGDGHAMAARAGAQMMNMEFIQFHPTTFYSGSEHRRFLISEALRGEGAKLYNCKNERFMQNYHSDLELAPRDVVSRAIQSEMIITKEDFVYLDISHMETEWIKERFPTIYEYCLEHKIDITKDKVPVVPAAHYTCGGVKSDLSGRTNLKGLFVVGEVACNGLHGANRLASTSLLEGLTFGYICAENIVENINSFDSYDSSQLRDWINGSEDIDLALVRQDLSTLKQTMWNYLGLTRTKNRMARASAMFGELSDEVHKFYKHAKLHDELIGLRNSVEVAFMVLNASKKNKKSAGCFYREN